MSSPAVPLTEEERLAYQTVAARRAQFDAAVWSTPALSVAALTFLLTIATNPQIPSWIRLLGSALGVLVGLAAVGLMHRHRVAELADAAWLAEMEAARGMPAIHGEIWLINNTRPRWNMPRRLWRWFEWLRVYHLWMLTLILFTAGAAAVWIWVLVEVLNHG